MGRRLQFPSSKVLTYIVGLLLLLLGLEAVLFQLPYTYEANWFDIVFWSLLVVWAVRAEVRLPVNAMISHLFVVALGAAIFFPPWVVPVLIFVFRHDRDLGSPSYPWYKDLFNRTQEALAGGAAALTWYLFNIYWQPNVSGFEVGGFIGALAAAAVYCSINLGSVAYVIHLANNMSFRKVWFENFSWLWKSYLVLAPIGLLLARAYETPLIGGWGGFTVMFLMLMLYYSRFYWDEKVKLEESFDSTIEVLVRSIEAKDPYTRLHSERVAAITKDIATEMGFDEADLKRITYAARIHDIGKVGIPDSILLKASRLSGPEFELIKSHPEKGLEVLRPVHKYLAKEVQAVIGQHHERWDGQGYPQRRSGDQVHKWARIVALADAYEAMTAGRKYTKAKTPQEALNEVVLFSGRQFDPAVVRTFEHLWLQNPIWRDREEFLRAFTSLLPFSDLPLPSSSESSSATLPS